MASPLIGAWEMVDTSEGKSLAIFTDHHYCFLYNANGRKGFSGGEPSEAEEAAAFRTMRARAGTYTVSESLVTLEAELTRNPVGRTQVAEITQIDDGSFTWKSVPPDGGMAPSSAFAK